MRVRFTVDYGKGPTDVTTSLYAIVAWERQYSTKAARLAEAAGLEDLAFLAWTQLRLDGKPVPAQFDDFLKQVTTLDVQAADTGGPTVAAPTDDN